MVSLGAILPFSGIFSVNLNIFLCFLLIFLFAAAIYSIISIIYFSLRNFKDFRKEFSVQLRKNKKLLYPILFLGIIVMILGFFENLFFIFGILIFILPYFYVYVKAVDECCMIKEIKTSQLREGDWLYKDIKIGKKIIKAKWEGLKKEEIKKLKKKYKRIKIRQGIPFSPTFLISFLILIYFWKIGLWNSFW